LIELAPDIGTVGDIMGSLVERLNQVAGNIPSDILMATITCFQGVAQVSG
jgi:hypothetical protein